MKKILSLLLLFIYQPMTFAEIGSVETASKLGLIDSLKQSITEEPFLLVTTLIFILAIVHSLSTGYFSKKAHEQEARYELLIKAKKVPKESTSVKAGILHLLGEIEVVFGLWTIALGIAMTIYYDFSTFTHYLDGLKYTEPLFVITIMGIAASRPILMFFENIMYKVVMIMGDTLDSWWLVILIIGPLLGSLITEPAAMTICAYLLSEKVFAIEKNTKVQYASLGLLFVNISIGGSLTNFAAPPILMVKESWDWSLGFMLLNFGWKAVLAIVLSTGIYYVFLKKEFASMKNSYELYQYKKYIQKKFISQKELEDNFDELAKLVSTNTKFFSELSAFGIILKERIKDIAKEKLSPTEIEALNIESAIEEKYDHIIQREYERTIPGLLDKDHQPRYHDAHWDEREDSVPFWIQGVHLMFLVWTIFNSHNPVLFLGGFLFYLGFFQVTDYYQNRLDLKPPLMVAFFLAGLMIHGTLQEWWIVPILSNLNPLSLNFTSIALTAFNDNAALTYLATLVPDFSDPLKYAVVAGAISGGGLTIIANAPNPIGVSILKKHFEKGISPLKLIQYALLPTLISTLVFLVFRP